MAKAGSDADATAERIRQLNEEILTYGKQAGTQFLEAYEATLKGFAEYQDKFADSAQAEWVTSIARAQANFTREVAKAYADTAREMMKGQPGKT